MIMVDTTIQDLIDDIGRAVLDMFDDMGVELDHTDRYSSVAQICEDYDLEQEDVLSGIRELLSEN